MRVTTWAWGGRRRAGGGQRGGGQGLAGRGLPRLSWERPSAVSTVSADGGRERRPLGPRGDRESGVQLRGRACARRARGPGFNPLGLHQGGKIFKINKQTKKGDPWWEL